MKKNVERSSDIQQVGVSPIYYFGQWASNVFRWVFLICISFIILYPLLYMVSMALRSPSDFLDITVVWLPKTPTLDNFKTAIFDINLMKPMLNTISISLGSSILQIASTSLAGYGFARFNFKGRPLLFAVVLLTIIIPPQMVSMPNYLLFKNLDFFGLVHIITGSPSPVNLLDTPFSYWLPAALGQGLRAGVFVLVFRQFFSGMPVELEEAALIDGCGYGKTFFRIMLPNASTPIAVYSLFSLVWYWGDYYLAYINLSQMRVLSTQLKGLRMSLEGFLPREQLTVYYIIPIEQAACLFSILPLIIIFLLGQRYFVQGIDRTGLVG